MKNSFIYIVLSLLFFPVLGQEKTTKDILTSHKWCLRNKDRAYPRSKIKEAYMIFNDSTIITCYKYANKRKNRVDTSRYYIGKEGIEVEVHRKYNDRTISELPNPVKFDLSKVGQNKNGEYILEERKREDDDQSYIYEIIFISDKELIMISVSPDIPCGTTLTEWNAQSKD